MDFFSRASHDEFLTILPTATEEVSLDIMARIRTAFFGNKLQITEADSVQIDVNFGWASFWRDGETPEQLLNVARLRKLQSKSPDPQKVLWFPNESLN
jgi:GGDEF domain-containing protein